MITILSILCALSVVASAQWNYTQLWSCNAGSSTQSWTIDTDEPYPYAHIYLTKSFDSSTHIALVLDVESWSNNTGAVVWAYPNNTGLQGYNEQWSFSGSGHITR